MDAGTSIQVIGKGGLRGVAQSIPETGTADIQLQSGQHLNVPVAILRRNPDGSYQMPLGPEDLPRARARAGTRPGFSMDVASSLGPGQSVTVPVVQEQVNVGKEKVQTGSVVVQIVPQVQNEHVHMPLAEEHVEVERIPVNEFVAAPRPIREEGDTTIIPVYDEVLVVERRLLLREEVRVRRQRVVREEEHDIPLRTEEVHILRSEPPNSPPAAAG